ncbi:MAG: hypothetical protein IJ111_11355 [Eggerthellaceae bacterium]|nr:hypothetical protein [Eggerthellaceae bacterium]
MNDGATRMENMRPHGEKPARLRDQSETEGRIGEGKNAGVRNVQGGTQRDEMSDRKRVAGVRNPDVRVGAKGVMQQDIGESICQQSGNDCAGG